MSRPKTASGASALLLVLPLALATAGCGKFREISACRGVEREVNTAVGEIEALAKAKPLDELRIAKRYAALAQALQPRSVGEAPLAQAVREYIVVLRATDTALKNHFELIKAPYGRPSDARRELERLVKREHVAAARLDIECHN
jgi:hypothetical protein